MTVSSSSPSWRATTIHSGRFLLFAAAALLALSSQTKTLHAIDLANSFTDWSVTGTAGENDWFYGYRNFTADGGGAYDFGAHFIPFFNDGSGVISPTNQWTGDHYRLEANPGGTGGPWTELFQENTHPNGTNSQPLEEHWTIRRWVANTVGSPTELALEWQMRKTNTGGGDGVGGFLYVNGVQLDTATIGGTDGVGVLRTAVTTINPGDVIDLALTPNLLDGADGSAFRLRITDEIPPPPPPPPIADSRADWTTDGSQGANNWFNGYYNFTNDGNGQYNPEDLIPFLSDGTTVRSPTNHWNGTDYRTVPSSSPWTSMGAEATHPQGTNSTIAGGTPPNQEHWTVRRWVADVAETTPLAIQWSVRKNNTSGNGVENKLFVNGVEVDGATIAGNNTAGINRTYYANVNPGDLIELTLGPNGADGSDSSSNRLVIDPNIPAGARNPSGIKLADSQTGWNAGGTAGTQGLNNWFYGYYDVAADAVTGSGDGQYGVGDLTPYLNDGSGVVAAAVPPGDPAYWTNSANHWDGSKWDLANNGNGGRGPWTETTQAGGHPAANGQGTPEVHWAMRRWISDFDGDVEIMGLLNNGSASGDGVIGRIFVDGVEVWDSLSNGTSVNFNVFATVANGSVVDFAIDPDGANVYDEATGNGLALIADGSDGTNFNFMILEAGELFVPIPEPSSVALALFGVAGLGLVARRRRR